MIKRRIIRTKMFFVLLVVTALLFSCQASANQYTLKEITGKTIGVPCKERDVVASDYRTTIYFDSGYKVKNYSADESVFNIFPNLAGSSSVTLQAKKSGTSVIKLTLAKGKKTKKVKFTANAYLLKNSPLVSVKFSGKKPKYFEDGYCYYKASLGSTKKGKLQLILKKGWSLKSAAIRKSSGKLSKLSLNKKFRLGREEYVVITIANKKNQEMIFQLYS